MCSAAARVIEAADRSCSLPQQCSNAPAAVWAAPGVVLGGSPVPWCEGRRWELLLRPRSRAEEVSGLHMVFTNSLLVNPGTLVMCTAVEVAADTIAVCDS